MSPDMQTMARIAHSGELGRIIAITSWNVHRLADEARGGGVVFRRAPHLIDTIRALGPGPLRSVRAMVGRWMRERPCPGNFSAYLEFEDGTPASLIYNGYGYFDTSELAWGIGNRWFTEQERIPVRKALRSGTNDAESAKEGMRFGSAVGDPKVGGAWGSPDATGSRAHINWFGLTVVNFERGDVRQSPNGLCLYDDDGKREIPVVGDRGNGLVEMEELDRALTSAEPLEHCGRWALGTLEVAVAIVEYRHAKRST